MSLTRIDPTDFVFNNDVISTSSWRDVNGNPTTTPSWQSQPVSYTVGNLTGAGTVTGTVTNFYIGTPANLQWSRVVGDRNGNAFAQAVYGAIRNIVYGDKNAVFEWGGAQRDSITVVSISKNCLKSSLLPGSFRFGEYTDDSNINPPSILNCGRAYNIKTAPTSPNNGFGYGYGSGVSRGLFLPDVGLIITSLSLGSNNFFLCSLDPTPTNHVFIRARNNQYNYSMNPSFISGSSGQIIYQDWFNNPQTYITTVGLYNDNNELMATAKLPRPYNKNFQNELLIQVGLNF